MHAALDKGISRRIVNVFGEQGSRRIVNVFGEQGSRGVVMRWVNRVVEGMRWVKGVAQGYRQHWIKESIEVHYIN